MAVSNLLLCLKEISQLGPSSGCLGGSVASPSGPSAPIAIPGSSPGRELLKSLPKVLGGFMGSLTSSWPHWPLCPSLVFAYLPGSAPGLENNKKHQHPFRGGDPLKICQGDPPKTLKNNSKKPLRPPRFITVLMGFPPPGTPL